MTNFPSSFGTCIKSLTIQLQGRSPAFDILSGSKKIKFERTQIHFFSDIFTSVVVFVAKGPYSVNQSEIHVHL